MQSAHPPSSTHQGAQVWTPMAWTPPPLPLGIPMPRRAAHSSASNQHGARMDPDALQAGGSGACMGEEGTHYNTPCSQVMNLPKGLLVHRLMRHGKRERAAGRTRLQSPCMGYLGRSPCPSATSE